MNKEYCAICKKIIFKKEDAVRFIDSNTSGDYDPKTFPMMPMSWFKQKYRYIHQKCQNKRKEKKCTH